MIRVPMKEGRTLHHDVEGRFGAGKVVLRSASAGTGIIAGGPMRAVFETLGIGDVVAKCLGSRNPHNMVKATFAALQRCASPRAVARAAARRCPTCSAAAKRRRRRRRSEAATGQCAKVRVTQIASAARPQAGSEGDAGRARPQQAAAHAGARGYALGARHDPQGRPPVKVEELS